jgi:hypothetical protein
MPAALTKVRSKNRRFMAFFFQESGVVVAGVLLRWSCQRVSADGAGFCTGRTRPIFQGTLVKRIFAAHQAGRSPASRILHFLKADS